MLQWVFVLFGHRIHLITLHMLLLFMKEPVFVLLLGFVFFLVLLSFLLIKMLQVIVQSRFNQQFLKLLFKLLFSLPFLECFFTFLWINIPSLPFLLFNWPRLLTLNFQVVRRPGTTVKFTFANACFSLSLLMFWWELLAHLLRNYSIDTLYNLMWQMI